MLQLTLILTVLTLSVINTTANNNTIIAANRLFRFKSTKAWWTEGENKREKHNNHSGQKSNIIQITTYTLHPTATCKSQMHLVEILVH